MTNLDVIEMIPMTEVNCIILVCCCVGLVYSFLMAMLINKVKIVNRTEVDGYSGFNEDEENEKVAMILEIGSYIEKGADAFLFKEYQYIGGFVVVLALILMFTVETQIGQLWSTFAFLVGAGTSLASGYIGMRVATFSNYRCAYEA
jgi:Na+/H+-translocating membrane pyrophosphatase